MTWFYNTEGEADGPHEESAMLSHVSAGRVLAQTLIWHTGLDLWLEAATLRPDWWQLTVEKLVVKTPGSSATGVISSHRSPAPLVKTEAPAKKNKLGLLNRLFGRKG